MATQLVCSLKAIAKRFLVLLVSVVMLFSFTQTAALAASFRAVAQSTVVLGVADTMPDETLNEKREQRREWQSRVSGTSDPTNQNADEDESLGERFNIGEITETMKDNLNLDDDADAKAAQSYRPSR